MHLLSPKKAPTVSSAVVSWSILLRQLLPFLGVFGPLVVFWAVFYQQNTTWVVQGMHMNCYIGKLHVPPGEAMQKCFLATKISMIRRVPRPHY